ncbi:DUF6090 family protein [Robiginitalea aurantiaca]|uniref:DUF6090 family protein n=1 Tax=Robiginitalea aurantiaca TaxID=3056915 RepID=A0ABT7WEW6_9FLAO|nr:DUF6090 family protein [Robiginitalea aurantiaca]MDM9631471.1 DUF6090 family protein [Robiginitalea aurantiaca]
MFKFFKRIRRNLLSQGKTGKYLTYALGEIVLVVIGILIALQINTWNESRKEIGKSRALLKEFRKDLVRDTLESNYVIGKLEDQVKLERWALTLVSYDLSHRDSLRKVLLGPYYQQPMTARTFNKLQNSENPNLTGFADLQNKLTKYYTDTKYLLDAYNEEEKYHAFENDINEIIRSKIEIHIADFPMLPRDNGQPDAILDFAQSIQGRNYIKENYIHRTGMIRYFQSLKQQAKELIELIDLSLKRESR